MSVSLSTQQAVSKLLTGSLGSFFFDFFLVYAWFGRSAIILRNQNQVLTNHTLSIVRAPQVVS